MKKKLKISPLKLDNNKLSGGFMALDGIAMGKIKGGKKNPSRDKNNCDNGNSQCLNTSCGLNEMC